MRLKSAISTKGERGGGDEMTFGLVLGVKFKPEISTKFLKRTFAQNHHLFQYFLKYLPYHGTRKIQKLHNLNISQCLKNWSKFLHNEGTI